MENIVNAEGLQQAEGNEETQQRAEGLQRTEGNDESQQRVEGIEETQQLMTGIRYEYVTGKRAGSKLLWLPAEGHMYKRHSVYKNKITYKCYEEGCPSRVLMSEDNVLTRNDKIHLHEDQNALYKELQTRADLLKLVAEQKTTNIRSIFNGVMERNQDSSLKFNTVRRSLQRKRAGSMPPSPTSAAEILAAFDDPEIMETFGNSKHNESRPFFMTAYEEEKFSYCIFASKASIDLVHGYIEEKDRCFLADATFKVVPDGIFRQLLIVFVEYVDKVFPLVFVLMSSKCEAAYAHVFKFVNENIISLKCKTFTTDFEVGMRNALRKFVGDEAEMRTCWFHYTQAVKRNASSISGFFDRVRKDKDLTKNYYKLQCLPLLPAEKITPSFLAIKAAMLVEPADSLISFLNYFERQWIRKEGPDSISVFNKNNRTTCAVEAYNGVLGKSIQGGTTFFRFVEALRSEEFARWKAFRDHAESGGLLINSNKKSYFVARDDRIRKATKELLDGKISASIFLTRVSYAQHKIMPEAARELVRTLGDEKAEEEETSVSAVDTASKCAVCLINTVKILLIPCKHVCVCSDCWSMLQQVSRDNRQENPEEEEEITMYCPTCRQKVDQFMEVFV